MWLYSRRIYLNKKKNQKILRIAITVIPLNDKLLHQYKTLKNILEQGELVAIPTETVYGLAGNIFNESAITKNFRN
jgi:tRNA A37 threonylcarbamoyladenosine synthetase subunit TsaC/SUA5/YrdC